MTFPERMIHDALDGVDELTEGREELADISRAIRLLMEAVKEGRVPEVAAAMGEVLAGSAGARFGVVAGTEASRN